MSFRVVALAFAVTLASAIGFVSPPARAELIVTRLDALLTTLIGYSSLLLAENRALYLFGPLAVLGEVACLTTAIVVLPAVLLASKRGSGDVSQVVQR